MAAEAEKIGGDGRLSELLPLLDSLKRETELVASVVRVVVEKYDEVNGEYSPMTP